MSHRRIALARLVNQHLVKPHLASPAEVVHAFGAVQAQDYAGGKWGIAQRTPGLTDAAIDQAFADGTILRTHVLRPTWHFVTPADIRWMLALTAPRVHAKSAYYYRQVGLDATVARRSHAALVHALQGGKQLTRLELQRVLQRARLDTGKALRFGYIMGYAELEGVVCSGARRGKQFTWALLDERVPPTRPMRRDEAVVELVTRFFTTRGPATAQDFAWWSGLTVADARRGLDDANSRLQHEVIDGRTYWFAGARSPVGRRTTVAHLLPNYDEYFIGYRDRSAIGDAVASLDSRLRATAFYAHVVAIDGQLVGGWKRAVARKDVTIEVSLLTELAPAALKALHAAAKRYGAFMERPVQLEVRRVSRIGR